MGSLSSQLLYVANEGLQHFRPTPKIVFPELEEARSQREQLERAPQTQRILQQTQYLLEGIEQLPQTSYTHYRNFRRFGERSDYEAAYFLKRARLSAIALRLFLGQTA